jgi:carboxyl-terminal processing protease
MRQSWNGLAALTFLIVLGSLSWGQFAGGLRASPPADSSTNRGAPGVYATFTKAYSLVEKNFATPLNADEAIYDGALPGVTRSLDPHSTFLDPKEYSLWKEDQNGHYSGVGMLVETKNDETVVHAPFLGSPAYRAGIRPGDAIISVDGKSTERLPTNEVIDLLKGDRGSSVTIAVRREGVAQPISFKVVREDIIRPSVQPAFWLKPGIAYLKILSFGDSTVREMNESLKHLGEDRITGLVLDLRDNPGGLLNQAVDVSDHFLRKGQVVVSQRGRSSPEKVYTADHGNRGRDYPIVVLVNRGSASAAEIVSGALQDHDRAWVVGETTFGKGLVQTVFPLSDHTALALTTAHFYTPSGRLIQRDYSRLSFYDYYTHKDGITRNVDDVKMTDSGRTVYGGGGITPDEKYEAPPMDTLEADLHRVGIFAFTRSYFTQHSARLPEGWMPDNAFMEQLHDYLLQHGYHFTDAEFAQDYDWIRRHLAQDAYIWAFNVDASDQVFEQTDPEVAEAVRSLPQATALLQNARRVVVERMNRK